VSEEQREAILLRKFCEMSYDEVTHAMRLPTEAAARKAVSRAIKVLRDALGQASG